MRNFHLFWLCLLGFASLTTVPASANPFVGHILAKGESYWSVCYDRKRKEEGRTCYKAAIEHAATTRGISVTEMERIARALWVGEVIMVPAPPKQDTEATPAVAKTAEQLMNGILSTEVVLEQEKVTEAEAVVVPTASVWVPISEPVSIAVTADEVKDNTVETAHLVVATNELENLNPTAEITSFVSNNILMVSITILIVLALVFILQIYLLREKIRKYRKENLRLNKIVADWQHKNGFSSDEPLYYQQLFHSSIDQAAPTANGHKYPVQTENKLRIVGDSDHLIT